MATESVSPDKNVAKMVKNSTTYKNKGHRGALNQGGPHVPDSMHALKKGRKRG